MITVIDTETTGDGPEDQVIEVALVHLDPSGHYQALRRPTVPIDPRARGVHHITDEEISTCARPDWEITTNLLTPTILVAHMAEFDRRMLVQTFGDDDYLPAEWLCTYRCARHIWPEAPSHGLQALRYWLDLDVPELHLYRHLQPHRALYDAFVCKALLECMLRGATVEVLISLTTTPILIPSCPVGDNRGKPCAEVPLSFWKWLLDKEAQAPGSFDADLVHTARHWHTNPDRPPVILTGRLGFGRYRDLPWSDVPRDFFQWMEGKDFDADQMATARHYAQPREDNQDAIHRAPAQAVGEVPPAGAPPV